MRVVLDANVVFAAVGWRGEAHNCLLAMAKRRITVFATPDILEELREKFEVFWIMPGGTAHWRDPSILDPLREMFGQNLLRMDSPGDVSEFVASYVGVIEGRDIHVVTSDLGAAGSDAETVVRVGTALAGYHRRFDLGSG